MDPRCNDLKPGALTALAALLIAATVALLPMRTDAGGTLTPVGSPDQPIQILDHHVDVTINNGFARTEVVQTFFNPNDTDLHAVYSFPIPEHASLSEMSITSGETVINGEVVPKDVAEAIYQEETSKGNDAGLARKNSYQTFEFYVYPVRAQDQTSMRFVYYQPIDIDTGVGRFLYPLEDGGTDDLAAAFWTTNERVENSFSIDLTLKSACPVTEVRTPGFEAAASIEQISDGHYHTRLEGTSTSLNRDFVFYYRLADDLPGRVELIPFRDDPDKPGTFMLVITPGIDLKPLVNGADYLFILDVSGSMEGKLQTLANGVSRAIAGLRPEDRLRIVTFADDAQEMTRGWIEATPENVEQALTTISSLRIRGGTNLYAGIGLGLKKLDDDRATSVVLVTDAVTNRGILEPKEFRKLVSRYDVRFFGFLVGNSANFPLMQLICDTTGGFFRQVSNADDVLGQIILAKGKITSESLHDVKVGIRGANKTLDVTDGNFGKIYKGQQLVLFGRYDQPGTARLTLDASLTGEDKTYSTTFDFPAIDTANPEVERLWALNRIEAIEMARLAGDMDEIEAAEAIEYLGLQYQLVTDETSMLVLPDEVFEEYGIDRKNLVRTAREYEAFIQREQGPIANRRVDVNQPMFDQNAPNLNPGGGGSGGGAIDPVTGVVTLGVVGGLAYLRRRRNAGTCDSAPDRKARNHA